MTTEQVKRCDVCRKFTEPVEEFTVVIKKTCSDDDESQRSMCVRGPVDLCPRHLVILKCSIDRHTRPPVRKAKTE
jgi:hypothetical protein